MSEVEIAVMKLKCRDTFGPPYISIIRSSKMLTQDQSHLSAQAMIDSQSCRSLVIFLLILCVRADNAAGNNFRHFDCETDESITKTEKSENLLWIMEDRGPP